MYLMPKICQQVQEMALDPQGMSTKSDQLLFSPWLLQASTHLANCLPPDNGCLRVADSAQDWVKDKAARSREGFTAAALELSQAIGGGALALPQADAPNPPDPILNPVFNVSSPPAHPLLHDELANPNPLQEPSSPFLSQNGMKQNSEHSKSNCLP